MMRHKLDTTSVDVSAVGVKNIILVATGNETHAWCKNNYSTQSARKYICKIGTIRQKIAHVLWSTH